MRQPPLTMGAAKESGTGQQKSTDMVTGEAENMRLQLVTQGLKPNPKVPGCKHLPPSQEREKTTMKVQNDTKLQKKISNSSLVRYTFKVPITL